MSDIKQVDKKAIADHCIEIDDLMIDTIIRNLDAAVACMTNANNLMETALALGAYTTLTEQHSEILAVRECAADLISIKEKVDGAARRISHNTGAKK